MNAALALAGAPAPNVSDLLGGAPAEDARISEADRKVLERFRAAPAAPLTDEERLASRSHLDGLQARAELVTSAVPLAEAAAHLEATPEDLSARISEGSLIGVRDPDGNRWLIPAFQFTPDGELPHLAALLQCSPRSLSALSLHSLMALPDEETGGLSPREWLMQGGDPEAVRRILMSL